MRPRKEKRIKQIPEHDFFKPANLPQRKLTKINLTFVEVEAIRLKDQKGFTQQEAAQEMDVSRSTFQRLLTKARQKIAEALIAGKAIKIEGGNYNLQVFCSECGNEFTLRTGREKGEKNRNRHRWGQQVCPECR